MAERTDYEQALRDEIAAIRRIVAALETLQADAQTRVVAYIVDRWRTREEAS